MVVHSLMSPSRTPVGARNNPFRAGYTQINDFFKTIFPTARLRTHQTSILTFIDFILQWLLYSLSIQHNLINQMFFPLLCLYVFLFPSQSYNCPAALSGLNSLFLTFDDILTHYKKTNKKKRLFPLNVYLTLVKRSRVCWWELSCIQLAPSSNLAGAFNCAQGGAVVCAKLLFETFCGEMRAGSSRTIPIQMRLIYARAIRRIKSY